MTTTLRSRCRLGQGFSKFKQCFPDRRRRLLCKYVCLVTVLLWHSNTSVLWRWRWFNRLWRMCCSLRPVLFVAQLLFVLSFFFFLKPVKVNNDLKQLLACIYYKLRLLKRIQCCCIVLPYLSSLRAPHNHIMFQSQLNDKGEKEWFTHKKYGSIRGTQRQCL